MHHGKGVSEGQMKELQHAGVDFFTSGNHIWKEKAIIPRLDDKKLPLIRPANYPPQAPGKGYQVVEGGLMQRVLVINLMGRVFMPSHVDCPFRTVDRILEEHKHEQLAAIFVDFHAETTSEKAALGHHLDGRVTAVIGTHTHVPTFDARILPGGTAFQSDVGFTGPIDSVIGLEKKSIIQNFITQVPIKHEVAEGDTVFNALKIEVDDQTQKAVRLEQIQRYINV
jgi:metallophosphoesterase (TIGR00282 family)